MNFSTHKDIEAPIDFVFSKVTNFDGYERQALRRGAQVTRVDGAGPVRVGSAWDVAFTFRSKDRNLRATVTNIDAPNELEIDTVATGLNSATVVNLIALSPKTTRVAVTVDMSAKSLSARLLLQSLKLAKSNLNRRFSRRVNEQVAGIAEDYKRST
ncbi:SRPBCC family protein [Rhodobacteraceae bacterium S2214]|nr:SRPBCC family protein [Rhodobacteraceae bacterium S2214]